MSDTFWNAAAYDDLSDPMFEWGVEVLGTLNLSGRERVLDAGCGSGRLTAELLSRLPAGEVVALDSSPQMIEQAQLKLAACAPRVEFMLASLEDFTLYAPVDGIFSNAVFHWVPDHSRMFRALHRALRPGGWLVAEFGGRGNLERALSRAHDLAESDDFAEYFPDFETGPHFENAEDTRARLEAAGFNVAEARLYQRTARFRTTERFQAFLETVVLRQPLAQLTEEIRRAYLAEMSRLTLAEEDELMLDYVRLCVRATA